MLCAACGITLDSPRHRFLTDTSRLHCHYNYWRRCPCGDELVTDELSRYLRWLGEHAAHGARDWTSHQRPHIPHAPPEPIIRRS